MLRPTAQSATAASSVNNYNFRSAAAVKRNPSSNSDKSHTSSVKTTKVATI